MKDLDLLPKGYKMMVVGSVQEEDCDGMCWQSIVNEYFNGPEDARCGVLSAVTAFNALRPSAYPDVIISSAST